jgi:hypothetical protein
VGSGSSLLSCRVFLSPPLSQAFPLLVAGRVSPLLPGPLLPTRLVYLQFWEGFPSPNLCSVRPTLFPTCLYCSYCLLPSFSFFPGWGSVCPGAMLLWPRLVVGVPRYRKAHLVCVFPSRLGGGDWWPRGALLVSLLNVKWRFSAPAGGVEGSKFCLFSVVLPAKCVSSVSPRFHCRRLTFCFLL